MGDLPENKRVARCQAGNGIRYVVPQKIVLDGSEDEITLNFRVLAPGKATALKANQEQTELTCRNVRRVSPGEMERLTVKASALAENTLAVTATALED